MQARITCSSEAPAFLAPKRRNTSELFIRAKAINPTTVCLYAEEDFFQYPKNENSLGIEFLSELLSALFSLMKKSNDTPAIAGIKAYKKSCLYAPGL